MSLFKRFFFNMMYFRDPPWDTGQSPPELMTYIRAHPPGRALDMGCGTGTNVITLAKHGWDATGVDFAGHAVQIAERKARKAGVDVTLKAEDVTRLDDIRGPFNLILDMGCFHSLSEAEQHKYIENLEQLLSREGSYLMYAFFKEEGDAGPGLSERAFAELNDHFEMIWRKDGSERGRRPSAWFEFKRPGATSGRTTSTAKTDEVEA